MPDVLVVDDFEPQLYARAAVLSAAGFDVTRARSGSQALAAVRDSHPAIVVLDVHLPDVDGFEVCRQIKADPATAETLVLHVSAVLVDADSRVQALNNGADGYLVEPVQADELVAQVRSLLRLRAAELRALEAQEDLRESRERLRSFFDASAVMMSVLEIKDEDLVFLTPNTAMAAFYGMTPQELNGRSARSIGVADSVVAEWAAVLRRCAEEGRPVTLEYEFEVGGRGGWYQSTISPIVRAGGPPRFAATIVDVSERKRTEEALRDSEETARRRAEELEKLMDMLPAAIWVAHDAECRTITGNSMANRFYEASEQENVSAGRIDGAEPDPTRRFFRDGVELTADALPMQQATRTGREVRDAELDILLPSGRRMTILGSATPLFATDQRVRGGIGVFVDITERKRGEQAVREARDELQRANRVKDDFLATLSHELRTPLTAILGWSHLLERGSLDAAGVQDAIRAITRNANTQRQLVSDVLDVSRMMAGKLRLELAEVDALEIARMAVASIRPAIEAKGVALDLVTDMDVALVSADHERLQQVIANLLSNAAKFTRAGGRITVSVREVHGAAEIVVSDTGAGIAPGFLPHVFDRFSQADTSMSRRHGGLGLGLSIVRQLVELHGGRVSAASDGEGKGAAFTVSLPLLTARQDARAGAVEQETSAPCVPMTLEALRVLIVDDLADARELIGTIVKSAGATPMLAECGAAALARLGSARPDVILADLGMPEMDGYEFLRRVRARPADAGGRVPVIAVTAYGSDADRARALAAGFAEHVSKPVIPADLIAIVSRVARPAPSA